MLVDISLPLIPIIGSTFWRALVWPTRAPREGTVPLRFVQSGPLSISLRLKIKVGGPAMTERRAKGPCLLINGDLEFLDVDQYILLFSHDPMVFGMCLTLWRSAETKCQVGNYCHCLLVLPFFWGRIASRFRGWTQIQMKCCHYESDKGI